MVVMTRNLVDLGEGKKYKYNAQYTLNTELNFISKIQLGVYYQCFVLIG